MVCLANCYSGGLGHLEKSVAVRLPGVVLKASNPGLDLVDPPVWEIAVDAGVDSMFIEIIAELIKLVLEISSVPKEELIKIFSTCGSD